MVIKHVLVLDHSEQEMYLTSGTCNGNKIIPKYAIPRHLLKNNTKRRGRERYMHAHIFMCIHRDDQNK
jgi:hypothetical protein